MSTEKGWAEVSKEIDNLSANQDSERDKHSFEAVVKRIRNLRDPEDELKLTPLRAHYLKKALVKLQVQREVELLSTKDALSTLGPPFRPSREAHATDLPILRYLFHHFVLTFPFLRSAPPNFFADKVQVFVDRFLERNISGSDDREEESKRRKLGARLQNYVVLLFGSAIRVKGSNPDGPSEEVIRIADSDRKRIADAELRMRAAAVGQRRIGQFDVNVVSVRAVATKGRLRTKVHEEFIIRTRITAESDGDSHKQETFVSRRYGDFVRLANTLRVEFPDEDVRPPPAKDKSKMNFQPSPQTQSTVSPAGVTSIQLPAAEGEPANLSVSGGERQVVPVVREKNRLTLRAYLRSLLAVPDLADSTAMQDFLTSNSLQLSDQEKKDVSVREELDSVREQEAARFAEESNKRVQELQGHLNKFKSDLVRSDGLTRIFATIKATPNMLDLPEEYLALIRWARISAASTLFHMFMGSDTSSELFAQLKRIHGLMPYFVLRGILRISNPVAMIRGGLDLFLAQPFGQKSLIQRMFSSGLQADVDELNNVCVSVEEKVADALLSDKVQNFVDLPKEMQLKLKKMAEDERLDLITVILRSSECGPQLNAVQVDRVVRGSRSYEIYKAYRANLREDEEDEGPQNEDAWLYEDLHVLLRCSTRLRDKQQMIELIFEGVTAELLKDMVTIFYSPLAQVYKAANIADSLLDLQNFVNDLIKTVETNEQLSYTNPQATVQVFMDLVARHEARFYNFVHQVHSKGAGLFDGLMHWIELFINFVRGSGTAAGKDANGDSDGRSGIGQVDLEICLPAGQEARAAVMHEVDQLVVYAYRRKLLREVKLRRRLAEKKVEEAADQLLSTRNQGVRAGAGLASDDVFVEAVVDNLGVGEMFTGEMEDAEAEGEDFDEDEDENSEGEGSDDGFRTPRESFSSDEEGGGASKRWQPPSSEKAAASNSKQDAQKSGKDAANNATAKKPRKMQKPQPPTLKTIPDMVPTFVELIRPLLRPARTASGSALRSNSYDVYGAPGQGQQQLGYAPRYGASALTDDPQEQGPPPSQSWSSWLRGAPPPGGRG